MRPSILDGRIRLAVAELGRPGAQTPKSLTVERKVGQGSRSLTDLSRTGEPTPDSGALARHPPDPDQRKWTQADKSDDTHETTDQKVGGSSPSECATVSAGRRPGSESSGSSFSSSGRILAVPASVAAWSRRSACASHGSWSATGRPTKAPALRAQITPSTSSTKALIRSPRRAHRGTAAVPDQPDDGSDSRHEAGDN
jgi:hypothetical protein